MGCETFIEWRVSSFATVSHSMGFPQIVGKCGKVSDFAFRGLARRGVVEAAESATGSMYRGTFASARPVRGCPTGLSLTSRKHARHLGWEPQLDLEAGVRRMLADVLGAPAAAAANSSG